MFFLKAPVERETVIMFPVRFPIIKEEECKYAIAIRGDRSEELIKIGSLNSYSLNVYTLVKVVSKPEGIIPIWMPKPIITGIEWGVNRVTEVLVEMRLAPYT